MVKELKIKEKTGIKHEPNGTVGRRKVSLSIAEMGLVVPKG